MPVFYLETSALLKRYRTEVGSDVVIDLMERRGPEDSFVTSYYSALEVEATIVRALRARLVNQRGYARFLGQFSQDLGDLVLPQPVTDYTLLQAIGAARRYGLRSGDAIHLAAALLVKGGLDPATVMAFVTSDGDLVSAAGAEEGIVVLDLRQPGAALGVLRQLRE